MEVKGADRISGNDLLSPALADALLVEMACRGSGTMHPTRSAAVDGGRFHAPTPKYSLPERIAFLRSSPIAGFSIA
jgi:hypothetical protein